jgi:hypothetical protein
LKFQVQLFVSMKKLVYTRGGAARRNRIPTGSSEGFGILCKAQPFQMAAGAITRVLGGAGSAPRHARRCAWRMMTQHAAVVRDRAKQRAQHQKQQIKPQWCRRLGHAPWRTAQNNCIALANAVSFTLAALPLLTCGGDRFET